MTKDNISVSRRARSEQLIADFENGFANQWFMAVGEEFKSELDIKKTKRKKNGQFVGVWTQGSAYNFKEGQVFYDTPRGYDTWSNALEKIVFSCRILEAESKIIAAKGAISNAGFVNFVLYKTNQEKTGLIEVAKLLITQDDFVEFLMTGIIDGKKINSTYG